MPPLDACAACFVLPLGYILLKGQNFFDVPRQFVSVEGAEQGNQFFANLQKLWLQLVGFGTFAVKNRKARMGRNPQTNEPIQIKASRTVGFRPGAGLKEQV